MDKTLDNTKPEIRLLNLRLHEDMPRVKYVDLCGSKATKSYVFDHLTPHQCEKDRLDERLRERCAKADGVPTDERDARGCVAE